MNPLFLVGAGALLSFRDSEPFGSFAKKKRKKKKSYRSKNDDDTLDMLVASNPSLRSKEDLGSPKVGIFVIPKPPSELRDEAGNTVTATVNTNIEMLKRVPDGSFDFVIMTTPPEATKLDESISDDEAFAVRTEFDRLVQLKHYQMMTLIPEPFVTAERSTGAFLAVTDGKVWGGSDYVAHREQDFPQTIPYESPLRSFPFDQDTLNTIISVSPGKAIGLAKLILQDDEEGEQ
jgi:hypothetical protein